MSKDANDVRRKLLKAMVYAPPVILGSMVVTPRTVMGGGGPGTPKNCKVPKGAPAVNIIISSGTNACCPCRPGTKDFIKGGGAVDPITGAVTILPQKCLDAQCIKSCGVNCTPSAIASIVARGECKDFCKVCATIPANMAGPCGCTCNKKGKCK